MGVLRYRILYGSNDSKFRHPQSEGFNGTVFNTGKSISILLQLALFLLD